LPTVVLRCILDANIRIVPKVRGQICRLAGFVLAAGQLVGFCTARAAEAVQAQKGTVIHQLSLSAAFSVTAERLQIDYTLRNSGPQDVYLLDVETQGHSEGEFSVRGGSPAIQFVPPDMVVLAQKLRPLDPTTAWTTPPRALASLLRPGESKQGTISLPLPLREAEPAPRYVETKLPDGSPGPAQLARASGKQHEVTCRRVRFVIGAIARVPALDPREWKAGNGQAVWSLAAIAWNLQEEVKVESEVSPALRVFVNQ
jgi:hypothetical protein